MRLALVEEDVRPRLVITGGRGEDPLRPLVDATGLDDWVELRGWVDDDELDDLQVARRAMAMPTLAEGFGLPVLEAMAQGLPVLASDLPVLREVGGDAALWFDPQHPVDRRRAAHRRRRSPSVLPSMAAAGLARAAQFTWRPGRRARRSRSSGPPSADAADPAPGPGSARRSACARQRADARIARCERGGQQGHGVQARLVHRSRAVRGRGPTRGCASASPPPRSSGARRGAGCPCTRLVADALRGVATVGEADGRVEHQGLPGGHHVDDQGEVLDDRPAPRGRRSDRAPRSGTPGPASRASCPASRLAASCLAAELGAARSTRGIGSPA